MMLLNAVSTRDARKRYPSAVPRLGTNVNTPFFDDQVQRTAGACVHTFPVSSEIIHCFAYPAITFCYYSHFKIASEKAKWRKVTYWVPCRASYNRCEYDTMCRFPSTNARSPGVNSTLGRH